MSGSGKSTINEVDRIVGGRARLLRLERGLSQQDVGTALGVSFQQVQKYEFGVNRMSASALISVARLLKVTVADLFSDVETKADAVRANIDLLQDAEAIRFAMIFRGIGNADARRQLIALAASLSDWPA